MKAIYIIVLAVIFPLSALAGRGDAICKTMVKQGFWGEITTPAITGTLQDKPADLAICFHGKDFSQDIARSTLIKKLPGDSLKVVSSSNVDGFLEMYVSLYNEEHSESVITRVVVSELGEIGAYPGGLISRQQIKGSAPKGVFVFPPSYWKSDVYFNFIEPTRTRLYRFHHTPGDAMSVAVLKKVSDSYGEWVKKNGDIIVSKDYLTESDGRKVYGAIISPGDKEKCKFDVSKFAWVLSALSTCN